jgi:hypothetical protein
MSNAEKITLHVTRRILLPTYLVLYLGRYSLHGFVGTDCTDLWTQNGIIDSTVSVSCVGMSKCPKQNKTLLSKGNEDIAVSPSAKEVICRIMQSMNFIRIDL